MVTLLRYLGPIPTRPLVTRSSTCHTTIPRMDTVRLASVSKISTKMTILSTRPAGTITTTTWCNGIWPATWPIYLIPAKNMGDGISKYWDLIGRPAVPPRYAFGFLACHGVGKIPHYNTLKEFRSGNYPIDAWISDFVSRTCYILNFLVVSL